MMMAAQEGDGTGGREPFACTHPAFPVISPVPGRKRFNPQGRGNSNTTNQLALPQPCARWASVSEEKDDVGRGNNTDLRKRN